MLFGVLQHDDAATLRTTGATAVLTPGVFVPMHNQFLSEFAKYFRQQSDM
jgi:hypothetical protein